LFFFKNTHSQINDQFGNPFIKNFSKKQVKIDLRTFGISQNKNGTMYFATPGYLLEYDGFRWVNYSAGEQSDFRDVLYVDDNHIYTSGHGGFGFWSKNEKGILEYTSLFFKYPTKEAPLLPVFRNIVEVGGKIYFQSFQQIYVYNPKNKELTTLQAYKGFSNLISCNKRGFFQDVSIGLFEIIDTQRQLIKGTEGISLEVIGVFEEEESAFLIATKNNGFWSVKDGVLNQKSWILNNIFEKFVITDIEKYGKDQFIVGTLRDGVYIISNNGKIVTHINKTKGINNNAISKVFNDTNNNIWLNTESGISYIEINSSTRYLLDTKSIFGTVYSSFIKDSLLYLGTNQGLFVKKLNSDFSEPQLIDNRTENIWTIDQVDGDILVGSQKGLSVIKNQALHTIHKEGGGWIFKKHPKIKDLLYVGFYSGLAVFKKINNQWKFIRKFENFGESSRFLEFDQYDQIWVAHPSKGYYRLRLSSDGLELQEVEFYGIDNPNIATYAYFTKIDGNLVFYNPKGFFFYDAIDNVFTQAKYPTEIFKGLQNINHIYQDENIFWYSTPKSLGYVLRDQNRFNINEASFYNFWNKHLNDFNKFKKIDKNIFGIGIEDGIVFHNIKRNKKLKFNSEPLVKSIELIGVTDTIKAPIDEIEELKIPYSNNYLKVKIALPKTPLGNSKLIQYKLNGFKDGTWSNWINTREINFPGISSGAYVLEIKAKGENEAVSKIVKIPFYIAYPWYISKWAIAFYVLAFIVIFFSYWAYLNRKNIKYVNRLKQLEKQKRDRQKEKFELEKLEADKKLLLLKEENLNLEIKKKNAALASSTLNNIKKNELLTDLINDIKKIDEELVNSSLHYPVKKVVKKINNHLVDKEDWLTFQLHFSNSHSQFFENLREKHSNLSSNEIKLSAYLKLNLSSKEIASLMNVAITSVEQSRYRLRKKFNLDKEENLVNYIQKF
jgi:ligand-binding sensor domain-containing protein/DNA-binding CsgD family transcriptional regulator